MKETARRIDLDELKNLAAVGGSDGGDVAQPYGTTTTPACSVIATITVSLVSVGCLLTWEQFCKA